MPNFLVQRYSSVLSFSKLLQDLLVWFCRSKWFAHLVSVGTAIIFWSAQIEQAPDIPVRSGLQLHAVCTLPNTIFIHHVQHFCHYECPICPIVWTKLVVNAMFHSKLAIKLKNLKLIPRIQLASWMHRKLIISTFKSFLVELCLGALVKVCMKYW